MIIFKHNGAIYNFDKMSVEPDNDWKIDDPYSAIINIWYIIGKTKLFVEKNKLCFKDKIFLYDSFEERTNICNSETQKAYKEFLFHKKMKELLEDECPNE